MKEAPITTQRRKPVLELLSKGPMMGADLSRAIKTEGSALSDLARRMIDAGEICRVRVTKQRYRYYLGPTPPEIEPEPAPREKYAGPVTVRVLPMEKGQGVYASRFMRVTLPAAPWEVRA